MQSSRFQRLTVLVHPLALLPFFLMAADFWRGGLGANPVREIQLRTGIYALFLLVTTVACRPLYTLTGIRAVLRLRRTLGLYALLYAGLHFLNLIGLDYLFDFKSLWRDVAEKRYILAGFPAFLILLAMGLTSTGGAQRRLGKSWRWIHRLLYPAAILAVTHYFWQVKVEVPGPAIYGSILLLLLLARLPVVERLAASRLPWRRASRNDRPKDGPSAPGPVP
jgi:sulfoxide reductase heme-binding subunit YedZ